MAKKWCLIAVFLLFTPVISAEDWFLNSKTVDVSLRIYSDVDVVKTTPGSSVKNLEINLSLFPQDGMQQKVSSLSTEPDAHKGPNSFVYSWKSPAEDNIKFSLTSDVKIINEQVKVKGKIKFPIEAPEELEIYTRPSKTIDSDDQTIFALANKLAEGEDDLYKVAFNMAEWVNHNIEYDLSTLTEDVTQSASWVLKARQGVCDEITNLFIALNRALGIPARFVSGVAYTSSEKFQQEWGPHGWAEVYFPGYGWLAFDVTYGEFGYVDPTHIRLKESLDADEAATKYQWYGNRVDIETKKLNFDIRLKEYSGKIPPKVSLEIEPLKSYVSFGSYNLVEVTVKNLKDYYLAQELRLLKPEEIRVKGDEKKYVLLRPGEEKKVYWIINVVKDLPGNFIYTMPLEAVSLENASASGSFTASEEGYFYDIIEIESIAELKQKKEEKVYSRDLEMDCSLGQGIFYDYEEIVISCTLKNKGNNLLENIDVCLVRDCKKLTLGISEEKSAEFDFTAGKKGEQEILIEAKKKETLANQFLEITVLDTPEIGIADLHYPGRVSFRDDYNISFTLAKESVSVPQNIAIEIESGLKRNWELNQLPADQKFSISLKGSDLGVAENTVNIRVLFYDDNGRMYHAEESFVITLNRVSAGQRIQIFFTDIIKSLNRMFA